MRITLDEIGRKKVMLGMLSCSCSTGKLTTNDDKRAVFTECCQRRAPVLHYSNPHEAFVTIVCEEPPGHCECSEKPHQPEDIRTVLMACVFEARPTKNGYGVALTMPSEGCGFGGMKFSLKEM